MFSKKIKSISHFEAWVLLRVTNGYFPDELYLRRCSEVVNALVNWLMQISPKERYGSLTSNLDKDSLRLLADVNYEAPPPMNGREWEIVPASDLDKLPPIEWLIDKEIPERGLTVLFGLSGAGKSFVALDYALRIAQQHPVIYIPTEGEAGYLKRVKSWCHLHKKREGNLFFLFGRMSLMEPALIETLMLDLVFVKPKLIVVDTLANSMAGADENSTRDMNIVTSACRVLNRNTGSAVMLVHHIGRNNDHERGSTALRGNADTMIRVNPADDLVSIECSKTKDEAPFETRYVRLVTVEVPNIGSSLAPMPATMVIRTAQDPLTQNQYRLLEGLSLEANKDGCTIRELGELCQIPYTTTVRTLSNLLRFGYVEKPRGSYAITNAGRIKIGLDPLDPPKTTVDPHKLADDPLDPLDPHIFEKNARGNKKSGSSGSSLKTGGSRVDHRSDKSGSEVDQAVFDMSIVDDLSKSKSKSYYTEGR